MHWILPTGVCPVGEHWNFLECFISMPGTVRLIFRLMPFMGAVDKGPGWYFWIARWSGLDFNKFSGKKFFIILKMNLDTIKYQVWEPKASRSGTGSPFPLPSLSISIYKPNLGWSQGRLFKRSLLFQIFSTILTKNEFYLPACPCCMSGTTSIIQIIDWNNPS